jgi:hypothetical protein
MTLSPEQQTGHIYVVDLQACSETYGWLLTAILLHKQPFIGKTLKLPQCTSAAKFKIKSPALHHQTLSIQHALLDGKRVYAEVAFNHLQLVEDLMTPEGVPNTEGELVEFNHVVVEYRCAASG